VSITTDYTAARAAFLEVSAGSDLRSPLAVRVAVAFVEHGYAVAPIREIAPLVGCHDSAVRRSVDLLAARGLAERVVGSGTFALTEAGTLWAQGALAAARLGAKG
jgi:DNA-binding IclR family transcriptional regulator